MYSYYTYDEKIGEVFRMGKTMIEETNIHDYTTKNDVLDVSVIIPTYKRSEDIARAVDSVLNQTIHSFEVIVVDDNGLDSDDGNKTAAVMEHYINDPKVIYIRHEINKNGSAARNTGIRVAKGRYISFLDDDDAYMPERLEKMVNKMDSLDESWGGCYTGYVKHQQNGKDQFSAETAEGDLFVQALMRSLYIGTGSNLFFRRETIQDIGFFDESFRRNQDLEYLVRVLKKYKMAHIDEVLMEAFFDIRTSNLTYQQNIERETMFRKRFEHYLTELSDKQQREVETMWNIDWVRYLVSERKVLSAIGTIIKSRISIKVLFKYVRYALNRHKTNTCYGFVVKL